MNVLNENEKIRNNDADVLYGKQFAEFLKSQRLYYMNLPETSNSPLFNAGIEFCHSIHQILLDARLKSKDIKEIFTDKVIWIEESGGVDIRIEGKSGQDFFSKGVVVLPQPSLFVQCGCNKIPPNLSECSETNIEPYRWDKNNGFGFGGNYNVYNGDAAKVADWFVKATKLLIQLRKNRIHKPKISDQIETAKV